MWADNSFASLAGVVSSGAVVAAVRNASPGLPVDESCTAPYMHENWLFAHNGRVAGLPGRGCGTRSAAQLSDRRGGATARRHRQRGAVRSRARSHRRRRCGAATPSVPWSRRCSTSRRSRASTCASATATTIIATACGDSLFTCTIGTRTRSSSRPSPTTTSPAGRAVPSGSLVVATRYDPRDRSDRNDRERITIDVHLDAADMDRALRDDVLRSASRRRRRRCRRSGSTTMCGSQLFDDITRLPEYYPTRREREILDAAPARSPTVSGADRAGRARQRHVDEDAAAARRLARRAARCRRSRRSTAVRRRCATRRERSPRRIPAWRSTASSATSSATCRCCPAGDHAGSRLVAFLGGTIGNLAPAGAGEVPRRPGRRLVRRRAPAARHRPGQGPRADSSPPTTTRPE